MGRLSGAEFRRARINLDMKVKEIGQKSIFWASKDRNQPDIFILSLQVTSAHRGKSPSALT